MEKFEHIGRNMMITDKYFKLYLRDALAPFDLNTAEGVVLLMMFHSAVAKKNTQEDLIRRIHYDKGVMTRTMKELEKKGYVSREPHPTDSRSYLFSLTAAGETLKDPLFDILRRWNERLLAGIDEKDVETVKRVLGKMAQNACGDLDAE